MQYLKDLFNKFYPRVRAAAQVAWAKAREYFARAVVFIVTRYQSSRVKPLVEKFRATDFGKWLEGHINRYVEKSYQLWRSTKSVYKKLTSPPPDPLMMALMSAGQKIDIDEDPTALKGNRLFVLIGAFFTILVVWAAFTELDSVVRADGQIVPSGSVQLVQNRLPGSVVAIRVALGDRVERGDIMFRLEDEEVNANFDDNEITRSAAMARVVRLSAEADGNDAIAFPDWMVAQFPDVVESEQSVFNSRRDALAKRLVVIEQQIRENEIIARNAEEKIKIYTPLVEAGHETRLILIDEQSRFDQASLAAERGRSEYNATLSNFQAEAARELSDVKTQADQASAREDAFRVKVDNAEVRAPVSGIITAVHVKTQGAVVQAGTVLAEIVPDEPTVLIEAKIFAQDVASVFPGQLAQISLSAYDVSRYGNLEGSVQRVAQNTMQDDPSLPPYYLTIIEIAKVQFSKTDEAVEIVPGMGAVVDIIGAKRTVLNYIFSPLDRAASIAFREQ